MAFYAFYPAASHLRRPDGIGFILAEGADQAAARVAAQALAGGTSIADFTAVQVTTGMPAVAISGLPVGARTQAVWPQVTRGGGFLGEA